MWRIVLITLLSSLLIWWFSGLTNVYKNFDGPLYVVVAETWYDKEIIRQNYSFSLPLEYYPAHLPLYPLLIKLFSFGLGNPFWAMLLTTVIGAVAGGVLIFKIAEQNKWGDPLLIAVLWLFMWPRMWAVRSVGSPETWFITFIMAALWLFEKKKYLWAGIFGGLAVWTKSPGVLLIPVFLIYNFYHGFKDYKRYISIGLIILAGVGLFGFYQWRTGDFWAYFHTGDNIHLGSPFHIFDSSQIWVGDAWLEDIIWIYLIGTLGVILAWNKNKLWAIWGGVFLTAITFVGHRDIARYSLPVVPTVLLGFSDLLKPKWVKIVLLAMIVPLFFYSVNFVKGNVMPIQNWGEFFSSSKAL